MASLGDVCRAAEIPGVSAWMIERVVTAAMDAAAEALEAGEIVDFFLANLEVRYHRPIPRGDLRLYIRRSGAMARARGRRKKFVSFRGRRWIRDLPGGGTSVEAVAIDSRNRVRGSADRSVPDLRRKSNRGLAVRDQREAPGRDVLRRLG